MFRIGESSIPGAGRGVFALRDIPRGGVVGRYGGEGGAPGGAEWHDYAFETSAGESLYPDPAAEGVHLCNDAIHPTVTGRENNACFREDDAGVCVVATRAIAAGEEVLLGYGWRYWADAHRDPRIRKHPAVVLSRMLDDEVRAGGCDVEVHMLGEAREDPAGEGTLWEFDPRYRAPVWCPACGSEHAVGDWSLFVAADGETVDLVCDGGGRARLGTLSEAAGL